MNCSLTTEKYAILIQVSEKKSEEASLAGCDITYAYIAHLIMLPQYDSCSGSFISYEACICRELESIPLAIQLYTLFCTMVSKK